MVFFFPLIYSGRLMLLNRNVEEIVWVIQASLVSTYKILEMFLDVLQNC